MNDTVRVSNSKISSYQNGFLFLSSFHRASDQHLSLVDPGVCVSLLLIDMVKF